MMGTVVKLPTAAARKVDNLRWAEQRRAMIAARRASPWPGEHLFPGEREARKLAVELRAIEQTPALILVSAILNALDADTYCTVVEQLPPPGFGNAAAQQALATAKASRLTVGQKNDLFNAFRWLDQQEKR